MTVPLVSVVMPCFNAEKFLEAAVASALMQTHGAIELLVVDDGSTDNSPSLLAALQAEYGAERMRVLHCARTGPFPARNLALREARGELVAFLDADDWWEPDFVSSAWAAMLQAQADIVYCGWRNVAEGSPANAPGTKPYVPPAYEESDMVEHFLRDCPWPIHAALVKRSVIDALGGFSERMFSAMDYDLWIRTLTVTRRYARLPRVLAYYRWHGAGQISAVKWRQVLHAWQVRRDFVAANPKLVAHIPRARRRELVDAVLLEQGKTLFWRRDLAGAQTLLRKALRIGAFSVRDLPLLSAAMMPAPVFRWLVRRADAKVDPVKQNTAP